MIITDTNIILRYILDDHKILSKKSTEIIENNSIFIPVEIVAEIVYVLEKVYKTPRTAIANSLNKFAQYNNVSFEKIELIKIALKTYSEKKIDFIDSVLFAYHKVNHLQVFTFDKKLLKLLSSKD